MAIVEAKRAERRAREHKLSRTAILEAARRVAARESARELSLRAVAAEAGFTPASLYGYFHNKDELLLALAADDLSVLARAAREAGGFSSVASLTLEALVESETLAAAIGALVAADAPSEAERIFNGRLIALLRALSDAARLNAESRQGQTDVVLIAGALAGLAMLARSGRLGALGFAPEEILARLEARFVA